MKTRILLLIAALPFLSACSTIQGPDGRIHRVVSPEGMAVLEAVTAVGVGAGTGALMRNTPGWANGAVSGLAGDVTGQILRNVVPSQEKVMKEYLQGAILPAQLQMQVAGLPSFAGVDNPQPAQVQNGVPIYVKSVNGEFVRVR